MTISAPLAPPTSLTFEGIACIMVGMLFLVGQDVLMKDLLGAYPVWMLIFTRSVVAVLVLTPLVIALGSPHRLHTPLWPRHLLRALLFASGFAPFDYIYLPYAAVIGYALWDEVPKMTTILGMSLIILSGVFIGHRELSASQTTDQPPPTAGATFAPGNPRCTIGLDDRRGRRGDGGCR